MLVDWWFIYILGVHVTCNMNVFKTLMSPSPLPSLPPSLPPPQWVITRFYTRCWNEKMNKANRMWCLQWRRHSSECPPNVLCFRGWERQVSQTEPRTQCQFCCNEGPEKGNQRRLCIGNVGLANTHILYVYVMKHNIKWIHSNSPQTFLMQSSLPLCNPLLPPQRKPLVWI